MLLALPKQTTILEQLRPAALAVALVVTGALFIPTKYPVEVAQGIMRPDVVAAGERTEVRWSQTWHDLCPITVTREFVGADSFKKTSATIEFNPPKARGVIPYSGMVVVPDLPVGDAFYHSVIQPHCWFDKLWQRTYRTPDIALVVVKAPPATTGHR